MVARLLIPAFRKLRQEDRDLSHPGLKSEVFTLPPFITHTGPTTELSTGTAGYVISFTVHIRFLGHSTSSQASCLSSFRSVFSKEHPHAIVLT